MTDPEVRKRFNKEIEMAADGRWEELGLDPPGTAGRSSGIEAFLSEA